MQTGQKRQNTSTKWIALGVNIAMVIVLIFTAFHNAWILREDA